MKHNLFLLASAGMFLTAPLLALESSTVHPPVVEQGKMMDQKVVDKDLSKVIEKAITSDKDLDKGIHHFNVDVKGGIVTLTGKADSQIIKSRIEAKVGAIQGVNQVINNIEVKEVK